MCAVITRGRYGTTETLAINFFILVKVLIPHATNQKRDVST